MMNTKQLPRELAADDDAAADFIAPVPRISVHAFCESDAVAAAVGFAKNDRGNIDRDEEEAFRKAAKHVLALSEAHLAGLVGRGQFVEVDGDDEEISE